MWYYVCFVFQLIIAVASCSYLLLLLFAFIYEFERKHTFKPEPLERIFQCRASNGYEYRIDCFENYHGTITGHTPRFNKNTIRELTRAYGTTGTYFLSVSIDGDDGHKIFKHHVSAFIIFSYYFDGHKISNFKIEHKNQGFLIIQ